MNGEAIELEMPMAVSENKYRRIVPGCSHPVISSEGRKYHETAKAIFRQSGQAPIRGRVKVEVEFYPPDWRRRDLDNLFKCLFDSLVNAGAIEDDHLITEIHAFKRDPVPNGLLFVRITKYEDDRAEILPDGGGQRRI